MVPAGALIWMFRVAVPADLSVAGFDDIDSFEAYYQATCGRDQAPESVLQQSVAATLASPAKLAQCPFPVDETVLKRMAGLL